MKNKTWVTVVVVDEKGSKAYYRKISRLLKSNCYGQKLRRGRNPRKRKLL